MNRLLVLLAVLLSVILELHAQGSHRYESEVFPSHQLTSNIQYGQSFTAGGSLTNLMLDLYTPTGDTATNRPLVIFIHGGGFKGGDKVTNFGTRVCGGLARRGYVVASINYRITYSIPNDTVHFEAMIRALQDAKASVRFFRRFSAHYGIDSTQIFVTGSSAGSITALHMAYLDSSEIPTYVRMSSLGSLEGNSGNPGFSSAVQGVISNWGALADFHWMKPGDAPVYCVHGEADTVVPHDSSFSDGPFKYGSVIVHESAKNLGISTGVRLFANTGHTLDNNASKQDSAIRDFSAWLFTVLKKTVSSASPRGENLLPLQPMLRHNYPNPFNPATTIEVSLPAAEHVQLAVFDALGQMVSLLLDDRASPGTHSFVFNATTLATGIYYCRLWTPSSVTAHRMLLIR